MIQILFLEPVFKEAVWGGDKLASQYGYSIPSSSTGECWAVSAHQNGDCTIKNGHFKHKTVNWLWENEKELFGKARGLAFPLLVKIIDAKEDLSIQVHPDDIYAMEHEHGSLGKTECWYILSCDKDASIIVGHNAKTKKELVQMIEEKRWTDLIREIPIKPGDFFQIPPGTVHAIKGGTMILETQQNSDITYRLYDYDRKYQGELRELHLDKSIDVICNPFIEEDYERHIIREISYDKEILIKCEFYTVYKLNMHGEHTFHQSHEFEIFSVIEGKGNIGSHRIVKGDHFILPHGFGSYILEGDMELIVSHI